MEVDISGWLIFSLRSIDNFSKIYDFVYIFDKHFVQQIYTKLFVRNKIKHMKKERTRILLKCFLYKIETLSIYVI